MKATLPSVSTTMEEGGFSLDEATIERIIDYFDMSADGEVDKGQFFIPLLPCSLFHPFNHFAAILKESSTNSHIKKMGLRKSTLVFTLT